MSSVWEEWIKCKSTQRKDLISSIQFHHIVPQKDMTLYQISYWSWPKKVQEIWMISYRASVAFQSPYKPLLQPTPAADDMIGKYQRAIKAWIISIGLLSDRSSLYQLAQYWLYDSLEEAQFCTSLSDGKLYPTMYQKRQSLLSSSSVTKIGVTSPLTVFLKYDRLDLFNASNNISD